MQSEVQFAGFGGQGVVLAGHIIGRAYAVNHGAHATMIQSFGPEARGSSCSATLVVSEEDARHCSEQERKGSDKSRHEYLQCRR